MENATILTTKQKIILATMNIIAEEGLEKTTVRKIASRAGVNIAAVNYHFGGKDAVINQSFAAVTGELRDSFQYLKDTDRPALTNLSMFINKYIDIMCKYPDLLKNAIDMVIRGRITDGQADYLTFLRTEGIEAIKSILKRIRPDLDQLQVDLRALQLISEISYPFLLGDLTREMLEVDLENPETRRHYTSMILQNNCRPGCH